MASNCGECLMNDVEIVELRDGVCPRCGADYTIPEEPLPDHPNTAEQEEDFNS